jgi:hypothetical protein
MATPWRGEYSVHTAPPANPPTQTGNSTMTDVDSPNPLLTTNQTKLPTIMAMAVRNNDNTANTFAFAYTKSRHDNRIPSTTARRDRPGSPSVTECHEQPRRLRPIYSPLV